MKLVNHSIRWGFNSKISVVSEFSLQVKIDSKSMDSREWSLWVAINNITNNKFISSWNDDKRRDWWHCGSRPYIFQMALIPRWSLMTEESKNLVKNVGISFVILVIGFALIRALFGYIVIAIFAWFAWNMLKRKWLPCKEYKDYAKNTRWLTGRKKTANILELLFTKDQRWYQAYHISLGYNFDRLIVVVDRCRSHKYQGSNLLAYAKHE